MPRLKVWLVAALVLAVGFLLGWSVHPTPTQGPIINANFASEIKDSSSQPKTVSVMLDFGDGVVRTWNDVELPAKPTLFETMKTLSESGNGFVFKYGQPGQYGIMIEEIGDKKNGDNGKYWLFWVNNRMGEKAADATALASGDVIEWKFVNLKLDSAKP